MFDLGTMYLTILPRVVSIPENMVGSQDPVHFVWKIIIKTGANIH